MHALNRAMAAFVDQKPLDPRSVPKVSVNVGVVEGGSGVNAIPALARAKVDIRSESNSRIDELVAALQLAVARAEDVENSRAVGAKVTAKIREIGNRPASRVSPEAPILASVRAVDAHWESARASIAPPRTRISRWRWEFRPCRSARGGKGGGAHTTSEWYRPDGRDLGLKRVALTAALLLDFGTSTL